MAKRRQFTPEFKARGVLDILTGVQSPAEACRKHGIGPNLLSLWKSAFLERAHLVFDSDSLHSAEQVRIAELAWIPKEAKLTNKLAIRVSAPAYVLC
jgi:transposase